MLGRLAALLIGTFFLIAAAQTTEPTNHPSLETPASIVRTARRAVEQDSIPQLVAHWRARLQQNPNDRLAALGLATIARLTYDYDNAAKQYEALTANGDAVATYALLGLAWQADTRGRIAHADTLFLRARRAARASNDRIAEAEAMLGWALERGPIDGAHVALAIIDSAGELIPESGRELDDLRAEYWIRRAVLSAVLSKPDALKHAAQGRSFAQQAGVLRLEAKAVGARALHHLLHGEEEDAIVLYDTVAVLQRRARDFSALSETLYRQADALRSRGDLGAFKQRALQAAQEAERSHNDIVSRSVLVGLGALALFVHDYPSADRYLSLAVERQTKDGVIAELMLSRAHRAKLYFAIGEIDKARAETQAVIDYHRSTGDGAYEFTLLRDLIAIELRAKRIDEAERTLRKAETLARTLGVQVWNGELSEDRGMIALARGNFAAAQREFSAALEMLDSGQHIIRHAMRVRLAEVYALRGDLAQAEQELKQADAELDRWRETLTDRELRMFTFQTGATEQNNRDESFARTIAALARGGRAAGALQLAEHRRARELIDRVVQAQSLVETNLPQQNPVTSTTKALHQKAFAHDPLAAISDHQTAVLEYVTGAMGAPTTLFVVTRSPSADTAEVRGYVLPSADSLAPLIDRFVGLVEAGENPTALATTLGQLLLTSAIDVFNEPRSTPITRLVIIPDGPLHTIPFDALRLADGKFVVERFATSLAPSSATIAALRDRSRIRASSALQRPVRLLVFGDPVFANKEDKSSEHSKDSVSSLGISSTSLPLFAPTPEFETLPRLTGSAKEAQLIARYAESSEVRLRDRASAAYLKQAPLEEFRVLHFATHAFVNERTAARTALALTPGEGESGFVSPGEVAALSLNADLVVLSACRTAGGVVLDGEGVQGLTSSFLEAGAQSIVASQWRIGDQSTVAFIHDFYDALSQQLPVAQALRHAKLAALQRGAPPRDWAAFTVIGDPSVQVPFSPPQAQLWSTRLMIPGLVTLVGLLGIALLVARYRRAE
jgi:CHAT domain-containing protein